MSKALIRAMAGYHAAVCLGMVTGAGVTFAAQQGQVIPVIRATWREATISFVYLGALFFICALILGLALVFVDRLRPLSRVIVLLIGACASAYAAYIIIFLTVWRVPDLLLYTECIEFRSLTAHCTEIYGKYGYQPFAGT